MENFKSFEEIEEFVKDICKKSENLKNTIAEFNEKLKEVQRENNERSVEVEKWPQINDEYYSINDFGSINCWNYKEDYADFDAFEIGNAFKTKEEAEFEIERRKVFKKLDKYVYGYEPRFKDKEAEKRALKEIGEKNLREYLFGLEE